MGNQTRPARENRCSESKRLVSGNHLWCDREDEHPGQHRDDTEEVWWFETVPPLEVVQVPPPGDAFNIADTCCGKCPVGTTCYVDKMTGA